MGKGMGKGKGKPAPMAGGFPQPPAGLLKPSNVEQSAGEYGRGYGVFDASKKTYIGQVDSRGGGYGFIKCDETFAIYERDVYMYKTYFSQCQIGDWVKFNIHISEKGLPQVGQLTAR